MRLIFSLFLSLFTLLLAAQPEGYPQDIFRAPLDIPLKLSGTFGELRSNHFHSGIDIKTKGRQGLPVYAIAEGSIVRLAVSPYGFGRAVYVKHPNGYTSVYAHLQKFSDTLEAYLKDQQYRQKQNELNLFPQPGRFKVKKGEVIAYSGNSGGSGGPHLHFEIRDSRTEKIINPLLFGFEVPDSRYPELSDLMVYEFKNGELISSHEYRVLDQGRGRYSLAGNGVVQVNAAPAFGIEAIDRLDGAYNPDGVYRIEMLWNGQVQYDFRMNTFAFAETRYINSHIDFAQKQCCGKKINKLYLEPNNRLSVYRKGEKMHFPQLLPDSALEVSIRVSDLAGNTSVLDFKVKAETQPLMQLPLPSKVNLPVFSHHQSNRYQKENLEIEMPAGALYRDIYFEHQIKPPCPECLSDIQQVGAAVIPVHKYYTLRIKPTSLPQGLDKSKLCIVSLEDEEIVDYEGGHYKNGIVESSTRQFGSFAVVADTLPPEISAENFRSGRRVSGKNGELKIKVNDDLSGIGEYRAQWNGEWLRLYFDAKNKLLIIRESDLPESSGEQELKLEVSDERGNKSIEIFKIVRP